MIIHLIFSAIVTPLWMIGDHKQAWTRDLIIPFLVGGILILAEPFEKLWINILVGICTAGACNIIRSGYGAYDPINDDKPSLLGYWTKDTDGWVIRAVWGGLTAIISCLPYVIASIILKQPINIAKVLLFSVLFSFICFIISRLRSNVFWTGLIIGLTYSSISFVFKI